MKIIFVVLMVLILATIVGCSSYVPDDSPPLSQLSDIELQERIDKLLSSRSSSIYITMVYLQKANVYQNELILRELRKRAK